MGEILPWDVDPVTADHRVGWETVDTGQLKREAFGVENDHFTAGAIIYVTSGCANMVGK